MAADRGALGVGAAAGGAGVVWSGDGAGAAWAGDDGAPSAVGGDAPGAAGCGAFGAAGVEASCAAARSSGILTSSDNNAANFTRRIASIFPTSFAGANLAHAADLDSRRRPLLDLAGCKLDERSRVTFCRKPDD